MAHLEAYEPRTVVLGLTEEAPQRYYSFTVVTRHGHAEIAVLSSGLGIDPSMILQDNERKILVGHDKSLTWIAVEDVTVRGSHRLSGAFYEFLSIERDDEVVVVHELGALRVNSEALVKWAVDTDIVEEFHVDARGNLVLKLMDAPPLAVCLETGTSEAL